MTDHGSIQPVLRHDATSPPPSLSLAPVRSPVLEPHLPTEKTHYMQVSVKAKVVRTCYEKGRRERILRRMLDAQVPGNRRRGRQKTRWKDSCKRDMVSVGSNEGTR